MTGQAELITQRYRAVPLASRASSERELCKALAWHSGGLIWLGAGTAGGRDTMHFQLRHLPMLPYREP